MYSIISGWLEAVLHCCLCFPVGVWVRGLFGLLVWLVLFVVVVGWLGVLGPLSVVVVLWDHM
jgi:hypothetical protein